MNIPKKLYKYQPFTLYSIQNLKNNQIYFNSTSNFNDPYDCAHPLAFADLDPETIRDIYVRSKGLKNLEVLVQKLFDDTISAQELYELFDLVTKDIPDLEPKFQSKLGITSVEYLNHLDLHLREPEIFEKHKEAAKDGLTIKANRSVKKLLSEIRIDLAQKTGVSCFSELYDDLLMWSYYAGGHTGFCLEFDTGYEPFSKPFKVSYVTETPRYDPTPLLTNKGGGRDIIKALLATKFINWNHEKEWRILHKNANQIYTYPGKALTGLYIGSEMSRTNMEILALILKGQNKNVRFYQMKKMPAAFQVRAEEFTYTSHKEALAFLYSLLVKHYGKAKFTIINIIRNDKFKAFGQGIENLLNILVENGKLIKEEDVYHLLD